MAIGANPQTAAEINANVGSLARQFKVVKSQVVQAKSWMDAHDLKISPYNMTSQDEADLKSAVSEMNTAIGAATTTFTDRLLPITG